jgi:hypothetical protein
LLVPERDREALSAALTKVVADSALRQALQERSRHAQSEYFSWSAIAGCLVGALRGTAGAPSAVTIAEMPAIACTKSYQGTDAKK